MTDFTYGTCFTLKCKAFGAPTAQELPGRQKPTRGQVHSDFRWYSDLFILHGVNLTVETNKRAREMYFDKPLYGHFYILLLPLDGNSSDQQVKRRNTQRLSLAIENATTGRGGTGALSLHILHLPMNFLKKCP